MPTCDMHVHVLDFRSRHRSRDFTRKGVGGFFFRHLTRRYGIAPEEICDPEKIEARFIHWVETCVLDYVVILAVDYAYGKNGRRIPGGPAYHVGNDYVAGLAGRSKKIIFGASIHPYRQGACDELARAIAEGAGLIKWVPSVQGIDPADPACRTFYDRLASAGLPLLVHTGNEHVLGRGADDLNDPRRLIPALDRGVTVIAAHCGARMFLHERCYFKKWAEMALRYKNLFGDLGAMILPTRMCQLRAILRRRELAEKVVFGSDFPAYPMLCGIPVAFGLAGVFRARESTMQSKNPLDSAYLAMKSLGMPNALFTRGLQLLKVADGKKSQ